MRPDYLAIAALAVCSAVWLLCAVLLILDLLDRQPQAWKRKTSRASRRAQTAMLVMITMAVLSQVSHLARWTQTTRLAIDIATMIAALGFVAVLIRTATIRSAAKPSSTWSAGRGRTGH